MESGISMPHLPLGCPGLTHCQLNQRQQKFQTCHIFSWLDSERGFTFMSQKESTLPLSSIILVLEPTSQTRMPLVLHLEIRIHKHECFCKRMLYTIQVISFPLPFFSLLFIWPFFFLPFPSTNIYWAPITYQLK